MRKIVIQAKAGEHNAKNHRILNGVTADGGDNNFTEYFPTDSSLNKKIRYGAYMEFVLVDDVLHVRVKYSLKEELLPGEVEELKRYTQGQWSDGIGEGFEQFPCKMEAGEEILLSPWYRGQVVTTFEIEE